MAIGTAAAIGIGLAGVGSALGARSQSKAAGKAADTSMAVAQQNNALAANIYGQNKATLSPYVQSGEPAGNQLNAMLGLNGVRAGNLANNDFGSYLKRSDYAFQLGTGTNAINSGYAGAGTVQSGAAMKELERYRQDLQSGYRGEYMNALANQQGVGLAGASALAGVGNNYVSNISNNNNSAGTAQANAQLVSGANNPFANALGMAGGFLAGRA